MLLTNILFCGGITKQTKMPTDKLFKPCQSDTTAKEISTPAVMHDISFILP